MIFSSPCPRHLFDHARTPTFDLTHAFNGQKRLLQARNAFQTTSEAHSKSPQPRPTTARKVQRFFVQSTSAQKQRQPGPQNRHCQRHGPAQRFRRSQQHPCIFFQLRRSQRQRKREHHIKRTRLERPSNLRQKWSTPSAPQTRTQQRNCNARLNTDPTGPLRASLTLEPPRPLHHPTHDPRWHSPSGQQRTQKTHSTAS